MQKKRKSFETDPVKFKAILYLALLLSLSQVNQPVNGQEQVKAKSSAYMKTGFGIFDLLHIGFTLEQIPHQLEFSAGFIPISDETVLAAHLDYLRLFSFKGNQVDKKRWYTRNGLCFYLDETKNFREEGIYLNSRLGRYFFFSKRFGLCFDLGIMLRLYHYEIRYNSPSLINFDFPVLPSARAAFFLKL